MADEIECETCTCRWWKEGKHCKCGEGEIKECSDESNPNNGHAFYACDTCGYKAFHGINGWKWVTNWRTPAQKEELKRKQAEWKKKQAEDKAEDMEAFDRIKDELGELAREIRLVRQTNDNLVAALKSSASTNAALKKQKEMQAKTVEEIDDSDEDERSKGAKKKTKTTPAPKTKK